MGTVLVDYESGNLHSALKAFQRMAAEAGAGSVTVTSDPDVVARADRVVLPGDGAFPACRAALFERSGLFEAIHEAVFDRARPFFGICIGMQMMASRGTEHEPTPGFDWIGGEVVAIAPDDRAMKVPHMGWNELIIERQHPVLDGVASGAHAYFVHSYQMQVDDMAQRIARVDYGGDVTAIIARDNLVGAQFHPEKSQAAGLRMIENFLRWAP